MWFRVSDVQGGVAVPERSGGMKAQAGTWNVATRSETEGNTRILLRFIGGF